MREKPKERHAKINFQNYGSPPIGLPAGTNPVTFVRDSQGNISAYVDEDSGVGGGVGGGGSVVYGTRASLPGTPSADGTLYLCTDSPYSYLSDGSAWRPYIHSWPVTEPSGLTKINNTPTTTLIQTYGGYHFSATGAGDQVVSYVKAVTPSSTLRVAFGFHINTVTQAGIVIYNSNTGNVYFFRRINHIGYTYDLFRSLYTSAGATLSVPNTTIGGMPGRIWPAYTFILRFDSTNFYIDWNPDPHGNLPSENVYSEALATNIGANYTHVGFGVNMSGGFIWGQHLKTLST